MYFTCIYYSSIEYQLLQRCQEINCIGIACVKWETMLNFLYKLLLTFNSTSWVIVIYGIKEEWTICNWPYWVFSIVLLLIPVLASFISILCFKKLSKDNITVCSEVENANNTFIPTYLGYFFVGLSIDNDIVLIFAYIIIFIFAFIGQGQYFNPIYLLFGYKFYYVLTSKGTRLFIITRRNIRNINDGSFQLLRRINETTYVEQRRNYESTTSKSEEQI